MRWIVLLVALAGCYRDADPTLPPADVVVDASSPCGRACSRLAALGCPEGRSTPGGRSCVSVCEASSDLLPVTCVGAASSVADVRACGVRCRF